MKRRFIFILMFWAVASSSFAQQSGTVLTFKDAVQLALKNNVTLNTQRNNLYQSKALKGAGIAGMGPQIYVNGNVYRSDGNRFIQQEGKVVNAVVDGASASLNINQPILGGFSSLNNMRSTSNSFDAQLEQVNRSTEDVIGSVAMQYLQVLLDEELVKIAIENVAVQKAQYEQVKAQVELGARSPVDEYNQLALLSNAELRVAQAENTLVVDRTTLFQTLLVDPTSITKIESPNWDVNMIAMEIGDLQSLLSRAEEKRSDLKMVRYAEKASKYSWHSNKGI
jgi:outer membrane protein